MSGKKGVKRITKEITKEKMIKDFIERSKIIHNEKYDYSKVGWTKSKEPTTIICPIHGEFKQRKDIHLMGRGCFECGNDTYTRQSFIDKANKIHNNKYDYSKVVFKRLKDKVIITCPVHGDFIQKPQKHLAGHNCQKCSKSPICGSEKMTTEQFISAAKKVHKDRYDYSLVNYTGCNSRVKIICPKHGIFEQKASTHLNNKCGCSSCGFNTSIGGNQWIESFNNQNIIKEHILYITGKRSKKRYKVDGFDPNTNTIYEYFGTFWHGHPSRFDPEDIHPRLKVKYKTLYNKVLTRVRKFRKNGYKVVYKWGR